MLVSAVRSGHYVTLPSVPDDGRLVLLPEGLWHRLWLAEIVFSALLVLLTGCSEKLLTMNHSRMRQIRKTAG